MKVLITGGAGFIGSHLTKKLLNMGYKVIGFDNFSLGTKENLADFIYNKNYSFYEVDVTDIPKMLAILKDINIDIVYHLAANSDIQNGGQNPQIDYKDTFLTTYCILELMRLKTIKKLFFSSTSAIYGNITDKLLSEELGGLFPISYYGGAKLAAESFISSYTHMNDLSTIIFRFPNVIGPNLTHGVVYDFYNKLKNNPNKLEILGDGTQCKPYIHVYDLVDGIIKFTDNIKTGLLIYNIGVTTETTVKKIADIMCEEMNLSNVKYEYTGGNIGWKGDVPKFQYDLTKISKTGWKPKYSSDEAIRDAAKRIIKEK